MPERLPSTRWIVACAALYAILMFAFLGARPISRTQEARVLETARQMLDAPDWHGWLVPSLNGETRLRKPPLCYWYTAAAYRTLGVDEFAGRLPTLALGLATVAVTFAFGRDLLGRRGGFLAAAVLASAIAFVRFVRSAETDTPAMLGTVAACWAIHRAIGHATAGGRSRWFLLAALGIALGLMAKGGPAVFPVVFLALVSIRDRSWRPIIGFVLSGAPVVVAALSLPWFAYVLRDPAGAQVAEEVRVVATGGNHFGLFYEYVPVVLLALAPWSGLLLVALLSREFWSPVARAFRRREAISPDATPLDAAAATIACAFACVALPLCVTLNVQAHYVVPLYPACALVVAWLIERVLLGDLDDGRPRVTLATIVGVVFKVTSLAGLVVGPALLGMSIVKLDSLRWVDVLAASVLVAAGATMLLLRRRPLATRALVFATLAALASPIVIGWWGPRLRGERLRVVAAELSAVVGDRPLASYGDNVDVSLGFAMRRTIPAIRTEPDALRYLRDAPEGLILVLPYRRMPPLPPMFEALDKIGDLDDGDREVLLYARPTP